MLAASLLCMLHVFVHYTFLFRCDKHVNTAAKPAEVFELEHKLGKVTSHL